MADIVEATGLSKSTLIRYEKAGIIATARRDGRKWRYYTAAERDAIVARLKELELM